jgi:translation elongation factor EF-Tu-like GTPase
MYCFLKTYDLYWTIIHAREYGRRTKMAEELIGEVSDFFTRPVVAGIDLIASLNVGDTLHIVGHTTDLKFTVESMQIDNLPVNEGKAGDSVGIKVSDRVRRGDKVYKVTD